MKLRTWAHIVPSSIILLSTSCIGGWAAPQPQAPAPPAAFTQEQYDAFAAAGNENVLDQFVANNPNSALLPGIYRAYYMNYFSQQNYPQMIKYVDKLLALDDRVSPGMRLEALVARAQVYFVGCADEGLRTPDAYRSARDAAIEGVRAVQLWEKAANLNDDDFTARKASLESLFESVTLLAGSALASPEVDFCKTDGRTPAPMTSVSRPDAGRFERMIQQIREEERQSPPVR